ncbi:MAG: (deoxy)nucleoside triphosphate pyrophosphohydrolase [Desulfuromonadales bacterium]|nr:(deoxy)nucleoside triphosphate pyrophosphohydrolase [Desulfuromonadales bacterium]
MPGHLHVGCAIVERDGLVLVAQRSAQMSLPLKWEFPGGKIGPGESVEACLRRELYEELALHITPATPLPASTHHYPDFIVTLYPCLCTLAAGTPVLHEHAAIAWLPPDELHTLDWADADWPVIESYLLYKNRS